MNRPGTDGEGHRQRLRDRFSKTGCSGFSDHELLEILLFHAIVRKDTKAPAKALLNRFGSLHAVFSATESELTEVPGIGPKAAGLLKLVQAASERMLMNEARERFHLSCPESLYRYCRVSLGALSKEQFRAYYLNVRNELLAEEILHEGTVDQAVVFPRTVVELALRHQATGVLFAHNHPGGSLEPSKEDLALTRRLSDAAATVGVKVHDHLIVTRNGFLSFHERGLL